MISLLISTIGGISMAEYSVKVPLEINTGGALPTDSIMFVNNGSIPPFPSGPVPNPSFPSNPPIGPIAGQDPECEYIANSTLVRIRYDNDVLTRIDFQYAADNLNVSFIKSNGDDPDHYLNNSGYASNNGGGPFYRIDNYISSQQSLNNVRIEERPICRMEVN